MPMELAYRSQSVLLSVSWSSSIGCPQRQRMSNQTSTGFDEFAGNYEAALQQGLSVTGESKDYFAQGRIEYLKRHLDNRHPRARLPAKFHVERENT